MGSGCTLQVRIPDSLAGWAVRESCEAGNSAGEEGVERETYGCIGGASVDGWRSNLRQVCSRWNLDVVVREVSSNWGWGWGRVGGKKPEGVVNDVDWDVLQVRRCVGGRSESRGSTRTSELELEETKDQGRGRTSKKPAKAVKQSCKAWQGAWKTPEWN